MLEDCIRCGACCFSESVRHARVTGDDYTRLGADAERLVAFIGIQAFVRIEHDGHEPPVGRCAALVLDADAGTYLCSVYERRPDVCRKLGRGSPSCAAEHDAKRERAVRALVVLQGVAKV